MQQHQRIVASRHVQVGGKRIEQRRRHAELARKQELPVVALLDHRIQVHPGVRRQEGRDFKRRLHLH